jgi:twitching motility protein PilT
MSAVAVVVSDAMYAARARRASDLHLVPRLPPVLRVDGKLQPWDGAPIRGEDLDAFARDLLGVENRGLLMRCGDVTTTVVDAGATVRIHAHRVAGGTALSLRFLSDSIPGLSQLGLPPTVAELACRPHGMLVLGGPTGSGKSTTLAALIEMMNREMRRKIITIEDPIEYTIPSKESLIVQRQVGRDVPSFADAVIGALRSDPDVVVIGEMRDPATISAALTAAETGHLVVATLHAGDASQCVDRLVDAFEDRNGRYVRGRIAQVLVGVAAQRLVERAKGTGRRAVVEILVATDAVRHLIRDGRPHQLSTVMTTGRQFGMQTFAMHLSELLSSGDIRAEAAEYATL